MNENSIKFRTIQTEFKFEHRYGDRAFFFVWKTATLNPEQIPSVPNPRNLWKNGKVASFRKRHKNCAWHKHNLNIIKTIQNLKKGQEPLELKFMKEIA